MILDPRDILKKDNGVIHYSNFLSNWMNVTTYCYGSGCIGRLMGPLNEPGLWGTICAFLLFISHYKYNCSNFFILASGMLTQSLAFFILLLLGFLFKII
jgi:hypothetical protein